MEIQFETEKLRRLCTNRLAATKEFGKAVAEQLGNRVSDLKVAGHVLELPVGLSAKVEGLKGEIRFINLTEGYELSMIANNQECPIDINGMVNWPGVDRVRIIKINLGGTQ